MFMAQLRGGEVASNNTQPGGAPQNAGMTISPTIMQSAVQAQAMSSACPRGYAWNTTNKICMSSGCYDGRSPCLVRDQYGKSCSLDQMLAFAHQTGVRACGPAPTLPPPPATPTVPPPPFVDPGFPADVSPSPGTKVVVSPTPGLYTARAFGVPIWALALGGLTILGITIALLARR